MSDNTLAMTMQIAAHRAALSKAAQRIDDLEAQLALTKMLYARDLIKIREALSDEYLDVANDIIDNRLMNDGTEIDISTDDVVDAIRNFDKTTGSKGGA